MPGPPSGSTSIHPLASLVVCATLLGLLACGDDANELRSTDAGGERSRLLSIDDTATASLAPELASLVERMREARVAWSVGTLDGPPETRWGLLVDAEVDRRGRVFALDRQNVEVRAFGPDGAFLGSFLSQGDGPLEMREPWGIETLEGDSALIFSGSEAVVVSTATLDAPEETRKFTFQAPSVTDLCSDGSTLYARLFTMRREGPLQRLGRRGEALSAWGHAPEGEDPGARAALSRGLVACGPSPPRIVTASFNRPTLRAYAPTGDSAWSVEFADFGPSGIAGAQREGMPGYRRTEGSQDRILTLVEVADEAVVVQVARVGARVEGTGRSPIEQTDTFLVSTRTGEGIYVGSHLPMLLDATENVLIAVEGEERTGLLRLVALRW